MSSQYRTIGNLQVADALAAFAERELLPRLQSEPADFWAGVEQIVNRFSPRNTELLAERERLQKAIDAYHRRQPGLSEDAEAHRDFLESIDYLHPPGADFTISTERVDAEIAQLAGPQLVVPLKNARFALNACNARWGSLYDALYGSDVIAPENRVTASYDPGRGQKVIAYVRAFLDQNFPLAGGSHADAVAYSLVESGLEVTTATGTACLKDSRQLVGYCGAAHSPGAVLLKKHGLHVEIQFDRNSTVGREDSAGICDVVIEAALTTIQDCEDSIAAVDAEDKVAVYRNWLGLILGDLEEQFVKGGETVTRRLSSDRDYKDLDGNNFSLPGRSLLLIRNVGHLMRNEAVLDAEGNEIYEGILDAILTSAIGALDVLGRTDCANSRRGSIYIVKPKMHGPDEVTFCCELFAAVEVMLRLTRNTIKLGIMDEERRTTVNLKECIRAASERLVFINTGFLDRTGDEIHTSMEAGPMIAKGDMKSAAWLQAYEQHNVNIGLACGLGGRAQIGKGMWAMPDRMAAMLKEKIAHPKAGASTAWVPSPTAAVLHALHYHQVDVAARQKQLAQSAAADSSSLLRLPLLDRAAPLSPERIERELKNNAQGILGYVVRWIDQGIGCSKVPDIDNVGLMEDRATLRISSQHLANWLHHGICDRDQLQQIFLQMAAVVDEQNRHDPHYQPMTPDTEASLAYQAAWALVDKARSQPNGYTEPLLHHYRKLKKGDGGIIF